MPTSTASSFTNTTHGRDAYLTVKALGDIARWSYIYLPTDVSTSRDDLAPFGPTARRLLKRVDIFEVSPVLTAAGLGTRTNDVKTDDELLAIADNVRRIRKELNYDPEIYAIWQQLEQAGVVGLQDLRFI